MVDGPHSQPVESVLSAHATTADGPSPAEARQRLAEHGENEVVRVAPARTWTRTTSRAP